MISSLIECVWGFLRETFEMTREMNKTYKLKFIKIGEFIYPVVLDKSLQSDEWRLEK